MYLADGMQFKKRHKQNDCKNVFFSQYFFVALGDFLSADFEQCVQRPKIFNGQKAL